MAAQSPPLSRRSILFVLMFGLLFSISAPTAEADCHPPCDAKNIEFQWLFTLSLVVPGASAAGIRIWTLSHRAR